MKDGELISLEDVRSKEDLAYRAYQMRMAGDNWTVIAERLGYKSGVAARDSVETLIDKATRIISDHEKEEILQLELNRLDALQSAVWGMAMGGDLKAVDSALKIMAHRSKLLKLEESEQTTTNTVIVTGDTYAESLKALAKK